MTHLKSSVASTLTRRRALTSLIGMGALGVVPWATQAASSGAGPTIVQIADMSAGQMDVSKDFLTGSRTAWQEINAKGGVAGRTIAHQTLEVDGSLASVRNAIDVLKKQPQVIAVCGTVGGPAAAMVADLLRRDLPEMPHIAPWLQAPQETLGDNTFAMFASRQAQITHAVQSLAQVGIKEIGAVFATPADFSNYSGDTQRVAQSLNVQLKTYAPVTDLQQLASSLNNESPRILVFLGGTPELHQFAQGLGQRSGQRFIVAMSDVNLQTLLQLGLPRQAAVIATQVVPMVNSSLPVVRAYRESLTRYFDEPPTPQSLAGFLSARFAHAALQRADGTLNRANLMLTLQRHTPIDLGGFRIQLDEKQRAGTFVTQSMISSDGKLVG